MTPYPSGQGARVQCHNNRLQQVIAPITINYKQLNEWPELLERARAGGAGTPVRFTVSITRRLTSAGQEHYNTILLWTVSLPGAPNLPWLPWLSLQCIASKIQQGQKNKNRDVSAVEKKGQWRHWRLQSAANNIHYRTSSSQLLPGDTMNGSHHVCRVFIIL